MGDPSRCVVLVPVSRHIETECDRALTQLEQRGYPVWRVYGYSAIDQARSQMATEALAAGYEELMWIDSDINFDPDSVEMLRAHDLPVVCGIYPKKGYRELATHLLEETEEIVFGEGGGLLEIQYAATGFLLTKREVYENVAIHENLPICNQFANRPTIPYFLPMIVPFPEFGHWYLGEDLAFCERARRCGYSIMADTRIRLEHIGKYSYTWEDAGTERPKFSTYNFNIQKWAIRTRKPPQ